MLTSCEESWPWNQCLCQESWEAIVICCDESWSSCHTLCPCEESSGSCLLCSWRILRQMSHFVLVKHIEAAVMLCSFEKSWGNCHTSFLWRILRQLSCFVLWRILRQLSLVLVKNLESTAILLSWDGYWVMLCSCEKILRQLPYFFLMKNIEATVMLCFCKKAWGYSCCVLVMNLEALALLCSCEESYGILSSYKESFCHNFLSCDILNSINVIIVWDFIAGILYLHIVFALFFCLYQPYLWYLMKNSLYSSLMIFWPLFIIRNLMDKQWLGMNGVNWPPPMSARLACLLSDVFSAALLHKLPT